MRTLLLLTGFYFLFSLCSFAQADSNKVFEVSKGTWEYPIKQYTKLEKVDLGVGAPKSMGFIANSSLPVKVIFDGKIVEIESFNNSYGVKVQYGSYYILYTGLARPNYGKGETVKRGEILANLRESGKNIFRIDISLIKNELFIDPSIWFKK